MWLLILRSSAAFFSADTTSKVATAGYSIGAYSRLVPSARTAPVAITTSPPFTSREIPPDVPMRMNVSLPHLYSSSTAIEALGPPIPVLTTLTFSPRSVPVYVTYSRLSATRDASSRYFAIRGTLLGSPGRMT